MDLKFLTYKKDNIENLTIKLEETKKLLEKKPKNLMEIFSTLKDTNATDYQECLRFLCETVFEYDAIKIKEIQTKFFLVEDYLNIFFLFFILKRIGYFQNEINKTLKKTIFKMNI